MKSKFRTAWSLFPTGEFISKFWIICSSFVNNRSKVLDLSLPLFLVGSHTCWNRKQSRMHSMNLCSKFCTVLLLYVQLSQFMFGRFRSPIINKWLFFFLQISLKSWRKDSLISSVESPLLYKRAHRSLSSLFRLISQKTDSSNTILFVLMINSLKFKDLWI